MKRMLFLAGLALLAVSCNIREIYVETEGFSEKGGWVPQSQYMDQMGSPYLMAHGLGTPVADAVTEVTVPEGGKYNVFVRTFNWTSPWTSEEGPGKFTVKVGDTELPAVLGCTGNAWEWQLAGSLKLQAGRTTVSLHDLTGFDGRCDAILLSTSRKTPEPGFHGNKALLPEVIEDGGEYEFIVVGGGLAGMSAAVAAARLGVRTALVHDRPVLGGNNSSEIRVHTSGLICDGLYPNLGHMMSEYGHGAIINGENDGTLYKDAEKAAFAAAEKNLTVFYNTHVNEVEMKDSTTIAAVIGCNTETGVRTRFTAPLFSDCTGDACLGVLSGAEYRVGRESKAQTGERSAAKVADCQVLGASVLWNTVEAENAGFPVFEYGLKFSEESVQPLFNGEWTWETGMRRDQVAEAEYIRDYGMLVAYSNWSYLKNRYSRKEEFAGRRLNWVSCHAGKRESRRLMGDFILNQTDIEANNVHEDGTVILSWPIDLHYPDPENTKYFPGMEFKSVANQDHIPLYPLPYRCLYSCNISNMFMAGRNISVTHAALGTIRVMRTTAMMGEVVGMAASVCKAHGSLPRSVYTDYFPELQALMKEGVGDKSVPFNQDFFTGRLKTGPYIHRFVSSDVE